MFNYDELVRDSELQPDEILLLLDSFWRHRTVPQTNSLVRYLTYGMLVSFLNNYVRARNIETGYNIQRLDTFLQLPWCPIIVYQDSLLESSFVAYGEGYDYDSPPEIFYGQAGTITRWVYPISGDVVRCDGFTNSITESTYWAGPTSALINRERQEIEFLYDPFDTVAAKTENITGRQYIVLWARNLVVDIGLPFDQVGWVLGYQAQGSDHYRKSLQQLWKLVIHGPSLQTYVAGVATSLGYPLAEAPGIIRSIQTDGAQTIVSTDDRTYVGPMSWPLDKLQGDELLVDDPIFATVKVFEYDALLLSTTTDVPGLLLTFPFSDGSYGQLGFINFVTAWDFDAGRPSPWRFPVSGSPSDIEKFWEDVDVFATANGIDFATLFSLPAAVNPMKLLVQQLLKSKVVVIRAPLGYIPVANPSGFHDRALELMSPGTMLVLQQAIGSLFDTYDLGTSTSETVGYGYHVLAPTETISVPGGGTDLTYFDYTPFVVTS